MLAALGLSVVACQGPEAFYRPGDQGDGGSFGTGGAGLVGSGGTLGTGGVVVTGAGGSSPATGGTTGTGGIRATGGTTGTGGTPATGGTKGTGGTPATGGTTGTGGSPATGGTGGKGTGGTPATGGTTGTGGAAATGLVVVDTDCQSAGTPQSIGLYLDVENTSSAAIPLSQITFRYYFQVAETTDPPHLDIDYSTTVPSGDITAKFAAISPAVTGANEYMEVGFTTAAGSLQAQSDTGQIQLRVHATNYANPFDSMQTTDYSFQTCAAGRTANTGAFAQQTTITAYVNGVLASGTEPN
ncbi:MAG TPA: cellulose binding domain-containing protein [Polyangia bacterium]|nr:cellulose binding domain-containing protein [Polyangia bacterium]